MNSYLKRKNLLAEHTGLIVLILVFALAGINTLDLTAQQTLAMNEINHPETNLIQNPVSPLNEIRIVGTDSASWFLFYPDDLKHRDQDPINWWSYDFAIKSEFTAGTMIGVTTGGDGSFSVRLTDEGLTEREKKHTVKSQTFRLKVRHNRLLIDGGYVLPSEEGEEISKDSADWINIPNGDYRVIVHALTREQEPGAFDPERLATGQALPNYVVAFEKVQNFNAVEIPRSIPQLDAIEPSEHTFFPNPESAPEKIAWQDEMPVIIRPEVFFPSIPAELSLTKEQYGYVERAIGETHQFQVLITDQAKPGATATLFSVTSYGGDLDFLEKPGMFTLTGHGSRIVQLTSVQERSGVVRAGIKRLEQPTTKAEAATVTELKERFARFAAGNLKYQKTVRYWRFNAERVAALTVPEEIGWAIASVLEIPSKTKRELLSASEKELIERLNQALKE